MIPEVLALATLLQSRALWMRDARAEYLASAILYAAGDDRDAQAALAVSIVREGGTNSLVEACAIPGMGGWGAFALATNTAPFEIACGPIGGQAREAHRVLFGPKRFDPSDPAPGFGRYIGASGRHREARERARLFAVSGWELEHLACF